MKPDQEEAQSSFQPGVSNPSSPVQSGPVPPQSPPMSGNVGFLRGWWRGASSRFSGRTLIVIFVCLFVVGVGIFVFRALWFGRTSQPVDLAEIVWWSTQFEEEDVSSVLKEYEAKVGVRVRYVKQAREDYKDRLVAAFERGEGPDVFEIHNTWGIMLDKYLDTLPSQVLDKETYEKTFYPVVRRDLARGEGFIGVPLEFDGLGLYYNENVLSSLGVLPPDDWNELRSLAFSVTSRDKDGRITRAGVGLGTTSNVDYWQDVLALMLIQNQADLVAPQGEQAMNAFSFFLSFSGLNGSWDGTLPVSTSAFAEGRSLFYFGPASRAREIRQMSPSLSFRVVPMPQLATTAPNPTLVTWASYRVQAVSSSSKAKGDAWEFLKYLSSREVLNVLAEGRFAPSRTDLSELFSQDAVLGAYVRQAPHAQSWYMASYTNDGLKGINTEVSSKYEATLLEYEDKSEKAVVFEKLDTSLAEVFAKYAPKKQ